MFDKTYYEDKLQKLNEKRTKVFVNNATKMDNLISSIANGINEFVAAKKEAIAESAELDKEIAEVQEELKKNEVVDIKPPKKK